ncbi:hypothetical protein AAFF_G00366870 [Aldrovandia affinis]|uniref:Uncharacterized protein n=1 Tax=Aldrovandia affinis TaxID=143900 RepID=A0AAD7SHA6_9TELE|nr:hypothetical protein AAFF_G00366870 [Aldrovandia affinis]
MPSSSSSKVVDSLNSQRPCALQRPQADSPAAGLSGAQLTQSWSPTLPMSTSTTWTPPSLSTLLPSRGSSSTGPSLGRQCPAVEKGPGRNRDLQEVSPLRK